MLANHAFWQLMLFYTHLLLSLQPSVLWFVLLPLIILCKATAKVNFVRIWCIANPTPSWQVTPPWNVYMAKFDPGWEGYLGGSPRLSCKRNQLKMRGYMERRVTPAKRVTSLSWGPPPPCKQALNKANVKIISYLALKVLSLEKRCLGLGVAGQHHLAQNCRDTFQHWIATNFMITTQTALATEGINCQIKEIGKERRYTFYLWSDRLRWHTARGRGRRHFALKNCCRDRMTGSIKHFAHMQCG